MGWLRLGAAASWLVLLGGCSSSEADAPGDPGTTLPDHMLVTADFTAQSLSVLDFDKLIAGSDWADAETKRIAVPAQEPGPLQVELTGDGKRAVAAVGPGFFDTLGVVFGFPMLETGPGSVIVADLETGEVTAELETEQAPMGLAIGMDDRRAYSANFGTREAGGSTISVIDLDALSIADEFKVGGSPEQIVMTPDGAMALFNTASQGGVQSFDVSDPKGTVTDSVATSADPSDIAVVTGDRALVTNSRGEQGYSVLDVSDPKAIVVLETVGTSGGIPYGATTIPGTTRVLVGLATGAPSKLLEVDIGKTPSKQVRTIELGNDTGSFPLGVAVTPDGSHAVVALPNVAGLAIVDLKAETVTDIEWPGSGTGPTYAAVHFR